MGRKRRFTDAAERARAWRARRQDYTAAIAHVLGELRALEYYVRFGRYPAIDAAESLAMEIGPADTHHRRCAAAADVLSQLAGTLAARTGVAPEEEGATDA